MDELHIDEMRNQLKDIITINEFLLKGIAPEEAQRLLVAKNAILLGYLDDTLETMKEALCKSSNIKAA